MADNPSGNRTPPQKHRLHLLKATGDLETDVVALFTQLTGTPPTAEELAALRAEFAQQK